MIDTKAEDGDCTVDADDEDYDYGDDPTLPAAEIARLRQASREARRRAVVLEQKAKEEQRKLKEEAFLARQKRLLEAGSSADCTRCNPSVSGVFPQSYAWFAPSDYDYRSRPNFRVRLANGTCDTATHLLPCDVHHNTCDPYIVYLGLADGVIQK